jgi:hypothetical protein
MQDTATALESSPQPANYSLRKETRSQYFRGVTSRLVFKFVAAMALVPLLAGTVAAQGDDNWRKEYDSLLGRYATSSGVKYAEWKANSGDMQRLKQVVEGIANAKPGGNRNDQLAFYINAYNAWILHEALGKYPTKSVKDTLFTFFTAKRIKVAGEQMSFQRLEKEIIIPKFGEPRIHFALNCASRSCPPLQAQSFEGGKLDSQLEKITRAFVNTESGVRYDASTKTAQLSKIFDWYKDDFAKAGGAVAFINQRRSEKIPSDAKVTYQDYNWALNEAK